MIKKNPFIQLLVVMFLICGGTAFAQKTYNFTSVPNDPLKTRIYTLDNGLKVFMTVYKMLPVFRRLLPLKPEANTIRTTIPDYHTTLNT